MSFAIHGLGMEKYLSYTTFILLAIFLANATAKAAIISTLLH